MNDEAARERAIADSWRINAPAWTRAVRGGEIASRQRVTDRAIVDAVVDCRPATVLDIGCGEGWLVRDLVERGIDARGVDGTAALVEHARRAGGRFDTLTYAELAGSDPAERVDALVCNFSLIGEASTRDVFRAAPRWLAPHGHFVVQTLHPLAACGDAPYDDGWRAGTWQGFADDFTDPSPWYFRTLDSWRRLFAEHGMEVAETREPADPDTGVPASVIFIIRAP